MNKPFFLAALLMLLALDSFSQNKALQYKSGIISFKKSGVVVPQNISKDWHPKLINLEMPDPDGEAYNKYLLETKQELSSRKNAAKKTGGTVNLGTADDPFLLRNFRGNPNDGSAPNDNDLAISNEGILISAINSNLFFYDTNLDSILLTVSLEAFADTLGLPAHMYDPKLVYDPKLDKFIAVWLCGNTDSTSNIIIGFSTTNNPVEGWNLYSLPGDTFAIGTWSDYPMIAITDSELFVTVNALINDTFPANVTDSWKFLFRESVIWQINKKAGFNGNSLPTRYYKNVRFNNQPIRNLCPIQGGSTTTGPNSYLLSNRNFDESNDTIFILEIKGMMNSPGNNLTIDIGKTNVSYGLPPDGKQKFNQKLQTNDSRILGGYIEDGKIHYVQNTVNPDTSRAAIYHGIISNLSSTKDIEGAIISEQHMDFGYPNISYTGLYPGDDEALITFNHTSVDTFAGFSAVYYNSISGYSKRINLKAGTDFVNVFSSADERWGDYSGSQRKYNEPGRVWASGFFGERANIVSRINSTWIAELMSPDTSLSASVASISAEHQLSKTYPNPFTDRFTVEFELPEDAFTDISLFDISGKLVKTFIRDRIDKGKSRFSFSLQPLAPGNYILTIRTPERMISSEKIVRQ